GQTLTGTLAVFGLLAPHLLPSLAEELAAPLGRLQLLGELITTRVPVQLVLGLIGRLVLSQDLPGDLPEITVRIRARRPRHPRAIDRYHLRLRQPRLTTQPQHLAEQVSKRLLMPNHEPRDRRVIRHHIAGDHPIGHILATVTLDRP